MVAHYTYNEITLLFRMKTVSYSDDEFKEFYDSAAKNNSLLEWGEDFVDLEKECPDKYKQSFKDAWKVNESPIPINAYTSH